jgi:hypothetical protein
VLPWARLIAERGALPDDLNLSRGQRASAFAAWSLLANLCFLVWRRTRWGAGLALLSLAALLALNARFYAFLAQARGIGFALRALPWHWLYFLSAALPLYAYTWPRRCGSPFWQATNPELSPPDRAIVRL